MIPEHGSDACCWRTGPCVTSPVQLLVQMHQETGTKVKFMYGNEKVSRQDATSAAVPSLAQGYTANSNRDSIHNTTLQQNTPDATCHVVARCHGKLLCFLEGREAGRTQRLSSLPCWLPLATATGFGARVSILVLQASAANSCLLVCCASTSLACEQNLATYYC